MFGTSRVGSGTLLVRSLDGNGEIGICIQGRDLVVTLLLLEQKEEAEHIGLVASLSLRGFVEQ